MISALVQSLLRVLFVQTSNAAAIRAMEGDGVDEAEKGVRT